MFQKFGLEKINAGPDLRDATHVTHSKRNFKYQGHLVTDCAIYRKEDGTSFIHFTSKKDDKFAIWQGDVDEIDFNFLRAIKRLAKFEKEKLLVKNRTLNYPRNTTAPQMETRSKLVLAQLDSVYPADESHLAELMKRKVIHKVKGRPLLEKIARKFNPKLKLDELYLVPMHVMPKSTDASALDEVHRRVIQTKDGLYSIKGIGFRDIRGMPRTLKKQGYKYEVPFELGNPFIYGGMIRGEITLTYETYDKLLQGWQKFKQAEPIVAQQLGVYDAPPFSAPVAAFKPLMLIARQTKINSTNPNEIERLTRIDAKHLLNTNLGGSPRFAPASILITRNQIGNFRLKELFGLNRPEWGGDLPTHAKLRKLRQDRAVKSFANIFKELKITSRAKDKAAVYRYAQDKMLAALYIARKYAGLAMHHDSDSNALMHEKDFTFGGFADTNNISPATAQNKLTDIALLQELDISASVLIHPKGKSIKRHHLYPYIINRI